MKTLTASSRKVKHFLHDISLKKTCIFKLKCSTGVCGDIGRAFTLMTLWVLVNTLSQKLTYLNAIHQLLLSY